MRTHIVGVDCATEQEKIGLALGEIIAGQIHVKEASRCSKKCTASQKITEWIRRDLSGRTLIAIDAPLGWPQFFGTQLSTHKAGELIQGEAKIFFRRATDQFVQKKLGKTPLDVGADRIARTAYSALELLSELRSELSLAIPLAWEDSWSGVAAIEVYPAATLKSYGIKHSEYKKKNDHNARIEIRDALRWHMHIPEDLTAPIESPDVLDAVVCLLAAAEFIRGKVHRPENVDQSKKEGWIWFTRKADFAEP